MRLVNSAPLAFQRCRLHRPLTGSKYPHETVRLGQKQHPWFSTRQPARDLGEHHIVVSTFYLNCFSPPSCNGSHRQGSFHPHQFSKGRRTSLEISQLHWGQLDLTRMSHDGPVKVSQPKYQLLLLREWKALPQAPECDYLPSVMMNCPPVQLEPHRVKIWFLVKSSCKSAKRASVGTV